VKDFENLETYLGSRNLDPTVKHKPRDVIILATMAVTWGSMIVEDAKAATIAATDDGDEVIPKPTDYRILLSNYLF